MAKSFHPRTRSVALLTISLIVAGLVFYGAWLFMNSHGELSKPPAVGITHSTPVGGVVEDGVYRSTPADVDSPAPTWRI